MQLTGTKVVMTKPATRSRRPRPRVSGELVPLSSRADELLDEAKRIDAHSVLIDGRRTTARRRGSG